MTVNAAFARDENFVPITEFGFKAEKAVTFNAATTGAVGTTTLFTVTGTVFMFLFAICEDSLAGTGTIEIGVSGATATLANQHPATDIDVNEVWHNGVLAIGGTVGASQHIINSDVIQTIGTNTVTGGTLHYYCYWTPISEDGHVDAV